MPENHDPLTAGALPIALKRAFAWRILREVSQLFSENPSPLLRTASLTAWIV